MKLYNLMEEVVFDVIDDLLKKDVNICSCKKCRLDIAAITLNNLPPKYIVTGKGKLFERANNMNYQFKADVTKEVIKAMKIVSKKPKHKDVINSSEE